MNKERKSNRFIKVFILLILFYTITQYTHIDWSNPNVNIKFSEDLSQDTTVSIDSEVSTDPETDVTTGSQIPTTPPKGAIVTPSTPSSEEVKNSICVNSIAELRKLKCKVGTKVCTKGYYSSKDNIKSSYVINKKSNTSDNGGSIIRLSNGLTAKLQMKDNSISVKQFGAFGDGKHDDTNAIQNTFDSGASKIVFQPGKYKLKDCLSIRLNDIQVYGNGSTLYTDNSYRSYKNFYEWLITIRSNNVNIRDLNIQALQTKPVGYKTQLGVIKASNIKITNCNFIIPSTVLSGSKSKEYEYTNVDLYTGWNKVTIKNCKMQDDAGCRAGSCLMARDVLGCPSSDLVFEKNYCHKRTQDEIIFIAGKDGSVKNVKILNNTIISDEKNASPCNVNISLGTCDAKKVNDIVFRGNNVTCKSAYTFVTFGNSKNVTVENNVIGYTSVSSKKGSVVFTDADSAENIKVKNNSITVNDSSLSNLSDFNGAHASFYDNKIICKSKIVTSIFSRETLTAQNNTITTNKDIGMIGNNLRDFRNNTVKLLGHTPIFFQYHNLTMLNNVDIIGNNIQYDNPGSNKSASSLIVATRASLNGHLITIKDNTIKDKSNYSGNYLYSLALTDAKAQSINFSNNNLSSYQKKYNNSNVAPKIMFD